MKRIILLVLRQINFLLRTSAEYLNYFLFRENNYIVEALGCFFILCSGPAWGINTQALKKYFPQSRAFTLIESQPKPKDTLTLGFGFNYAMQPFEFGISSTGTRVQGIVDHIFTFDFGAGYSLADNIAVGLNIPFHVTNNIRSVTNITEESTISFGDISVAGIYNILTREDSSVGFGLSVAPFLTLPTGASSNFVGESSFTGGVFGVVDMDYKSHYVGMNLGFRFREAENFLNLNVGQELLYKLAYSYPLVESYDLSAFGEFAGSLSLNQIKSNSSPMEVMLGASKKYSDVTPLWFKLGGGFGILNGYGTPDFRAVLQVTYDYGLPSWRKEKRPIFSEKIEKRLKELTIYYPTDGAQVDPFYDEKISGIAQIMNENPEMGPLYILSHTDDVGSDAYNQRLSERRAKQAFESILQHGIAAERVVSFGKGELFPAAPNTNVQNRALNRRTLFTFIKPLEGPADSSYQVDPRVGSDSYTEILKKKSTEQEIKTDEYYKEETKVEQVKVGEEEVYVNEDEGKVYKEKKKRRRYKKEKQPSSNYQEEEIENEKSPEKKSSKKSTDDDDFEESFVEY